MVSIGAVQSVTSGSPFAQSGSAVDESEKDCIAQKIIPGREMAGSWISDVEVGETTVARCTSIVGDGVGNEMTGAGPARLHASVERRIAMNASLRQKRRDDEESVIMYFL